MTYPPLIHRRNDGAVSYHTDCRRRGSQNRSQHKPKQPFDQEMSGISIIGVAILLREDHR